MVPRGISWVWQSGHQAGGETGRDGLRCCQVAWSRSPWICVPEFCFWKFVATVVLSGIGGEGIPTPSEVSWWNWLSMGSGEILSKLLSFNMFGSTKMSWLFSVSKVEYLVSKINVNKWWLYGAEESIAGLLSCLWPTWVPSLTSCMVCPTSPQTH